MVYESGVPDGRGRSRRALLASDVDRERTTERLKSAYAEGRLTADEHDERVGRAYLSRTYGELADLTADLPMEPGGALPPVSPTYQPYPPVYSPAVLPPPYHPVPQRPTNGLAAASLLTGLAGLPCCLAAQVLGTSGLPFALPAVAAVAFGHTARSVVRRSGEAGESAATCGAVLGYLAVAVWWVILLTHGRF